MYKAAVRWMIRRNVRALSAGDPGPLIAGYENEAVLVFPGPSSWGGVYEGREAIAGFLRRFIKDGIVGELEDVLVNGPPWCTRVCAVMTAKATAVDGTVVYDNRAVLYAIARWGRIVRQEDFEDTHKSVAFDDYLSSVKTDVGAPGQGAARSADAGASPEKKASDLNW